MVEHASILGHVQSRRPAGLSAWLGEGGVSGVKLCTFINMTVLYSKRGVRTTTFNCVQRSKNFDNWKMDSGV